MKKIRGRTINLVNKIKKWRWDRITYLLLGIILVILIIEVDTILNYFFNKVKYIIEIPRLFYVINGIALFISIFHLTIAPKNAMVKEHLLYKRLGPIFATPFSCLTYGTFIYCGLLIIYIVCYDKQTLMKYDKLDKITAIFTMTSIMIYAIYGIGLIVQEICNPKEEKPGKIVSNEPGVTNESEEENK